MHEHPATATSWEERRIRQLLQEPEVNNVIGDQCQYGLKPKDSDGTRPAKKAKGFMTNSICIARKLSKRCPNTREWQVHRHVRLERDGARAAQVYPKKLCTATCEGLIEQMEADRKGQFLVADYDIKNVCSSREIMNMSRELRKQYKTVEEDYDEEMELAWDDVSGAELNPKASRQARKEEIYYVRKMKLYNKVPISE